MVAEARHHSDVLKSLVDTPYGTRKFTIRDPDGNEAGLRPGLGSGASFSQQESGLLAPGPIVVSTVGHAAVLGSVPHPGRVAAPPTPCRRGGARRERGPNPDLEALVDGATQQRGGRPLRSPPEPASGRPGPTPRRRREQLRAAGPLIRPVGSGYVFLRNTHTGTNHPSSAPVWPGRARGHDEPWAAAFTKVDGRPKGRAGRNALG